ncbi:MAG: VWA domain-containing protein [Chloroflexi bacterium]|nr:VWA domain-containing protein [Chloroflexota bacterium]
MGITIGDIRRAIQRGGDVSTFLPILHRALGGAPIPALPTLETHVALPETTTLLKPFDGGLSALLEEWSTGKQLYKVAAPQADFTVIGLPPYGRNVGGYIGHVLAEEQPDVIALGVSPIELSAHMLYAFSIPNATGLSGQGHVVDRASRIHHTVSFDACSLFAQVIIRCWLSRIPLVPIGTPGMAKRFPQWGDDEVHLQKELIRPALQEAYHVLDKGLADTPDLRQLGQATERICAGLRRGMDVEAMVEEAGYIASRLMDMTTFLGDNGKKARVLALVDAKHYLETNYFIHLLQQGVLEEVYLRPKGYPDATTLALVGKHTPEKEKNGGQCVATLAQRLFAAELEKHSAERDAEPVAEADVDRLVAAIVGRTRHFPDITRGASVRGAIACKEVVQGFKDIEGAITRPNMEKAALLTLPPRVATKEDSYDTAFTAVGDIVKEVLYDIRFSRRLALDTKEGVESERATGDDSGQFSGPPGQGESNQGQGEPTIVPADKEGQQGAKESQRSLSKKEMERLMKDLEDKFQRGEITREEFEKAKSDLQAKAKAQLSMSSKELSRTVMELMDAKDKQWQKELSFQDIYTYYHTEAMRQGKEMSPPKQDYYWLKVLVDELERRDILKISAPEGTFTLTGEALDMLLEYLIPKIKTIDQEIKDLVDFGRAPLSERTHDIRRYTAGDVFRDLSIRHTLKEIARQKKKVTAVDRQDLRVFLKQRRRSETNLVLCVDTSGSMRYQHKLTYARLVAAGLAKAAMKNGDRVGIVTFDNTGRTTIPLTDNRMEIIDHVVSIRAGGNTNIGDGIKCATQLLQREPKDNQKHIVLITDGQPTALSQKVFSRFKPTKDEDLTAKYAVIETRKAAASGVRVSVVHVTDNSESSRGDAFVKDITRVGKGQIHRIDCMKELGAMMA